MQRLPIPAAALMLVLAGCNASIPVNGRMERSDETFRGAIAGSGYRGGVGELALTSSRQGGSCRGTFVNTTRRRGEGVLNCEDGRTGSFRIAGSGRVGNGSGELSGQRFTFTFEDAE